MSGAARTRARHRRNRDRVSRRLGPRSSPRQILRSVTSTAPATTWSRASSTSFVASLAASPERTRTRTRWRRGSGRASLVRQPPYRVRDAVPSPRPLCPRTPGRASHLARVAALGVATDSGPTRSPHSRSRCPTTHTSPLPPCRPRFQRPPGRRARCPSCSPARRDSRRPYRRNQVSSEPDLRALAGIRLGPGTRLRAEYSTSESLDRADSNRRRLDARALGPWSWAVGGEQLAQDVRGRLRRGWSRRKTGRARRADFIRRAHAVTGNSVRALQIDCPGPR